MNERCLRALQARRATLQSLWAKRLRAAPVRSPLGHPDTLVYLMDRTLDQVFVELENGSARKRQPGMPADFCRCGHNPLVTYFETATQAFEAALAQCADEMPVTRDDAEQVRRTLNRIARREIMTLCALCLRPADGESPANATLSTTASAPLAAGAGTPRTCPLPGLPPGAAPNQTATE